MFMIWLIFSTRFDPNLRLSVSDPAEDDRQAGVLTCSFPSVFVCACVYLKTSADRCLYVFHCRPLHALCLSLSPCGYCLLPRSPPSTSCHLSSSRPGRRLPSLDVIMIRHWLYFSSSYYKCFYCSRSRFSALLFTPEGLRCRDLLITKSLLLLGLFILRDLMLHYIYLTATVSL